MAWAECENRFIEEIGPSETLFLSWLPLDPIDYAHRRCLAATLPICAQAKRCAQTVNVLYRSAWVSDSRSAKNCCMNACFGPELSHVVCVFVSMT
jgi:hypothetical protein